MVGGKGVVSIWTPLRSSSQHPRSRVWLTPLFEHSEQPFLRAQRGRCGGSNLEIELVWQKTL